jgi:hypothetical protein
MTAPVAPGFPAADLGGSAVSKPSDAAHKNWVRNLAEKINNVMKGKMNNTLLVTLVNGATSTTVTDPRIGPSSALILTPLTTHAAALLYGTPYVLPTQQNAGSVVFTHASTANTDQNFILTIDG